MFAVNKKKMFKASNTEISIKLFYDSFTKLIIRNLNVSVSFVVSQKISGLKLAIPKFRDQFVFLNLLKILYFFIVITIEKKILGSRVIN